MSLPEIQVFASLQRVSPDNFILNDAVDGVLDTSKLSGFIVVDELIDVPILSLSINRGRSRQLERFNSGTATIVFDNRERKLDPLNDSSLFNSLVVPRVVLKVVANNETIYVGFVTDWDVSYDSLGNDQAIANLSDAFSLLSGLTFDADLTPSVEFPGERLQFVLDELGYLGDTDFDLGSSSLGAFQIDQGVAALDYLFQVQSSDLGFIFISKDGVVTYINRFGRLVSDSVNFRDDGTGMPYQSLNSEYSDDNLFNQIILTSPAGNVVKENSSSIADFGLSGFKNDDLLNFSIFDLGDVADRYLTRFSTPVVRFTGVTTQLAGLSDNQVDQLLRLDLTSEVVLTKTFGVGSPASVSQNLVVSGLNHQIVPGSHVVRFVFEDSPFGDFFRLDNVQFGILDTSILG